MKDNKTKTNEKINMSALPFGGSDIPLVPDKKPVSNVGLYVQWGLHNDFPDYLNLMYQNSPIYSSCINTIFDFTMGNDIRFNDYILSKITYTSKRLMYKILQRIVFDKVLTGGFALKLIYNLNKEICKIEWVDIRNLRLSLDEHNIYYSESWNQGRRGDLIVYTNFENFVPGEDENNPYTCIFYDKGKSRGIYPAPYYQGAIRSITTDVEINKFHLHSIQHGLTSSAIVNIPNGDSYSDEEKKIIERKFDENFCGSENSDGYILSFNPTESAKVEISRIADSQFDKKFEVLQKSTIKSIFSAFRIAPNLTGYLGDNQGFNTEEYEQSFNIFNLTVISPLQKQLINSFNMLFETENSLVIEPFTVTKINQNI